MFVPDQGKLEALRTGIAIAFLSPARGFLATAADTLRRTDDGGRTWRTLAVGFHFVSLSFVSPSAGFAITPQGLVFSTSDGGRSWRALHDLGVGRGGPLTGTIQFVDARHGWASPTGESVYGTSDGGASWSRLSLPCRNSSVAVSFVDTSSGFLICGGGAGAGSQEKDFYATSDGGQTWARRACTRGYRPKCTSSLPGSGYVGHLAFADARTGLLATDRGGIWRTRDGGSSWRQTLLTDDEWFVSSLSFASRRTVYALTMQDGSLLRSDDAGGHWARVSPTGPGLPTGAISFSSPTSGLGIGTSRILAPGWISATADGGVTWRNVGDLRNVVDSQLVRAGSRAVWAIGFRGTRSFVVRSTDNGRRWQRMPSPRGLHPAATLSFPTVRVGSLADGRRLFRTDDGGGSWQLVHTVGRDLQGAVFVTPSEGLLPTDGGLLRSGDGGRSWQSVTVIPGMRFPLLSVLDARHWWLAEAGRLLQTADGGRSWTTIRLKGFAPDVLVFATPNDGYARSVAGSGGLYRTSDGGRIWHFVDTR